MAKSLPNKISFIEPMYALGTRNLPEGSDWLYEIKLDGYRCLAGKDASGVKLWSRTGNVLTAQFPAIAKGCEKFPSGTLIDGEIVAIDENGRTSFNLLQHHRSKAAAIRLYPFDLLIDRGRSLIDIPLSKRRAALARLALIGDPSVFVAETIDSDAAALIEAVKSSA